MGKLDAWRDRFGARIENVAGCMEVRAEFLYLPVSGPTA